MPVSHFVRHIAIGATTVAILPLTSCSSFMAAGNAETDRISSTVADAISYPRQDTALGFARAALATTAGKAGTLSVIDVRETTPANLEAPFAHLVFRVTAAEAAEGFSATEPTVTVTACYNAEFSFYGISGKPTRTTCPADAVAITPPATVPSPKVVIPQGFDLGATLRALPATPTETEVRDAVTRALGTPAVDPATGFTSRLPTFAVTTRGADIGVAVKEDSTDCILGSRVNGDSLAWSPSRVQMQPGELTCDPETALARQGTAPPH
jgi:hypothetical protein